MLPLPHAACQSGSYEQTRSHSTPCCSAAADLGPGAQTRGFASLERNRKPSCSPSTRPPHCTRCPSYLVVMPHSHTAPPQAPKRAVLAFLKRERARTPAILAFALFAGLRCFPATKPRPRAQRPTKAIEQLCSAMRAQPSGLDTARHGSCQISHGLDVT